MGALLLALTFSLLVAAPRVHAQQPAGLDLAGKTRTQLDAIHKAREARTPAQKKISSQFLYARQESLGGLAVAGAPKLHSSVAAEPDGRYKVKITATVTPELLGVIKTLGGEVIKSYPKYGAIYALLPLANMETLAARPDVRFIAQPSGSSTNAGFQKKNDPYTVPTYNQLVSGHPSEVDTAVNDPEGDVTHAANVVRADFGATGAGIKVGVLSDSIDDGKGSYAAAVNAGYVSPVTVLSGEGGSGEGEGLAMLEIVHRLAPGATLYFATGEGSGGQEEFAQNIEQMQADGCQVIIDDVSFFVENPFQDETISKAVNTITARGVLYFSCTANFGNLDDGTASCWEGNFVSTNEDGYLNFTAGGSTVNEVDKVLNNGGDDSVDVELYWAEPEGAVTSQYDLVEVSPDFDIVQQGDDDVSQTETPIQGIRNVTTGDYVSVYLFSGVARFLHVDINAQHTIFGLATPGRTRGHNACDAPNSFCVAATPAAAAQSDGGPSGPYPNEFNSNDVVETFSDDGPRRMFFKPDGTAYTPGNFTATGGKVFLKPDLTAADGVTTSVPALSTFYGSSAAAPHAGAIAALALSAGTGATSSQVAAALYDGCVEITRPGLGDRDAGRGILLAPKVLNALYTITAPTITSFSPTSGPVGTTVTINGTHLSTAYDVYFGNTEFQTGKLISDTQLTAVVPPGATTGKITVYTNSGSAVSSTNFTVGAGVPVITSAKTATGTTGKAFSYQIVATGSPTSYGFQGTANGLSINGKTGVISGVPNVAGKYSYTLNVYNAAGKGTATLAVTIALGPPVITSATTATGKVGTAFSYQIAGSGSPTQFGFQGTANGLSINGKTGLISGKPTAAGKYTYTLNAYNAAGKGTATLTVTVTGATAAAPVITSAKTTTGTVGKVFSYQITATNSPTAFGFQGTANGLTINGTTGVISGTPKASGTYTYTLNAYNSTGKGTETMTMTVAAGGHF